MDMEGLELILAITCIERTPEQSGANLLHMKCGAIQYIASSRFSYFPSWHHETPLDGAEEGAKAFALQLG